MFFDPIYILVMAVTGVLSLVTSLRVKSAFAKWQQVPASSGRSGKEVAEAILSASGIHDVKVEQVGGLLSDHYDPRNKVLRLSPDVYNGRSVAASGVAAHEVGHALQHAKGYWPLQVRSYLAPVAAFGSNLSMIVFVAGLALGAFGLAKIGVALFAVMVLFTVITLPVEFDASKRAKELLLANNLGNRSDIEGVSSVLNAAALTYLAAAVGAVMQLIYMLIRSGLLGNRND